MPYTSPTGGTSSTIPSYLPKQTKPQSSSSSSSHIPSSPPAEDSVEITQQNPAKPTANTTSTQKASNIQDITKTAEAAEQATANSTSKNKPFYQPIIDFFQQLGLKIMDIFTPTSKEAIEKALIKGELKANLQVGRIARNAELLQQENLTDIQKAALERDTQKAEKKLKNLASKQEKLGSKLEKLEKSLTTTAIKPTSQNPESSTETEKATKPAESATKQTSSESAEKAAQETVEEIKPTNTIDELFEGLLKDPEGTIKKAENLWPEVEQFLANLTKKLKP